MLVYKDFPHTVGSYYPSIDYVPLVDKLVSACEIGNLSEVNRLLALPYMTELVVRPCRYGIKHDAFRRAASNGHIDVVRRLLQIDIVLKEVAEWNNYALRFAARNGHLEVVKYLLTIEAVREDRHSYIGLIWACEFGHRRVAECLLTVPMISKYAHDWHCNALFFAIKSNLFTIAEMLLKLPNVQQFLRDNKTRYTEILKLLLDNLVNRAPVEIIYDKSQMIIERERKIPLSELECSLLKLMRDLCCQAEFDIQSNLSDPQKAMLNFYTHTLNFNLFNSLFAMLSLDLEPSASNNDRSVDSAALIFSEIVPVSDDVGTEIVPDDVENVFNQLLSQDNRPGFN